MKKHYFIFIFILLCSTAYSQYFSKTIDLNLDANVGYAIFPQEDGLILLSNSFCNENTVPCAGVIKTDFEGNVVWQELKVGVKPPRPEALLQTDSTFLLFTRNVVDPEQSINLFELTDEGTTINEWNLGDVFASEFPFYMIQGPEGYIIQTAVSENNETIGWLQFVDFEFNVLSDLFFSSDTPHGQLIGRDIFLSHDEQLIITKMNISSGDHIGLYSKISLEGNVLWQKQTPESDYPQQDISFSPLLDSGYVMSGYYDDSNETGYFNWPPAIWGLDNDGEIIWEYVLRAMDPVWKYVQKLRIATNGDIIGIGYTSLVNYETNNREYCGWIFRLSRDGELIWERSICDRKSPIRQGDFINFAELPNGDLLFIGSYADTFPNAIPAYRDLNIWLVKVDSNGCLEPGCDEVQILSSTKEVAFTPRELPIAEVFPNPATDQLFFKPKMGFWPEILNLVIYDHLGRVISKAVIPSSFSGNYELMLDAYPPGVYFYHLIEKGILLQRGKFIRM